MQAKQDTTQTPTPPLVSFVITCYNLPAGLLRECIESILALSLRPYEREIVVVDDGSEVSPMSELADYGQHIVYLRKPNGGVSTARNLALHVVSGEYVQFVDGDDRLVQPPYEHCLDLIRYGRTDMLLFDFTSTQAEGNPVYEETATQSGVSFLRSHNIHGSVCGYLFRRSIVGQLRFTPGVAYGEDEEFTPQLLLRAESVVRTTAQAYYYRENPASVSRQGDVRHRLHRLNDAKGVVCRLHQLADTLPPQERLALQRRVAQLTMDYIYLVVTLTQSRHYLDRRLEELRRHGLFPLPDRDYSLKYRWFRLMTNHELGLRMLLNTLPRIKKER